MVYASPFTLRMPYARVDDAAPKSSFVCSETFRLSRPPAPEGLMQERTLELILELYYFGTIRL